MTENKRIPITKEQASLFRNNNFDLIRLFAALQVAIYHTALHLGFDSANNMFLSILGYFPGVPIFFFVSGFLISRSFESNSIIKEYSHNRSLRIFPALFVCVMLSVLSVYMLGFFQNKNIDPFHIITWIGAQISFFQVYNPEFILDYGVGVLNGSLWTVSVELQFYLLIPCVYAFFKLKNCSMKSSNLRILGIIFPMVVMSIAYNAFKPELKEPLWFKLFGASFLPWFSMFLIGMFVQRNFEYFHKHFSQRWYLLLATYLAVAYASKSLFDSRTDNMINFGLFLLLSLVIFSTAYSSVGLSHKLLRGNDISYDVYIYHMPIINGLIYLGFYGSALSGLSALSLTLVMSLLSWFLVEKPLLARKRNALHPVTSKL